MLTHLEPIKCFKNFHNLSHRYILFHLYDNFCFKSLILYSSEVCFHLGIHYLDQCLNSCLESQNPLVLFTDLIRLWSCFLTILGSSVSTGRCIVVFLQWFLLLEGLLTKIFVFNCCIYIDAVVIYFCKYMKICWPLGLFRAFLASEKFSFQLISQLRIMAIPICMMQFIIYFFHFSCVVSGAQELLHSKCFGDFKHLGRKVPHWKDPYTIPMSSVNVDLVYSHAILPEDNLIWWLL